MFSTRMYVRPMPSEQGWIVRVAICWHRTYRTASLIAAANPALACMKAPNCRPLLDLAELRPARLGEYYLTSMRVLERGRWHATESAPDGAHCISGTPLAQLAAMEARQRPCSLAGDAWGPHNPC